MTLEQLFAAVLFQQFDDLADLLRARPVGHQQRVRRIYDDQILDAQQRHQFASGVDIVTRLIRRKELRSRGVFVCVMREQFVDRVPAADVVPSELIASQTDHVSEPRPAGSAARLGSERKLGGRRPSQTDPRVL